MLLRKGSVILFVLVLLSIMATVSAGAASPNLVTKAGNGGYMVRPAHTGGSTTGTWAAGGLISPMRLSGTISQGQTLWFTKYISQGCPGFYTTLNWGNPSNDLQLTIFTADGYVVGPFDDGSDGVIDGAVSMYIWRNGGLAGGTYYEKVYGLSVNGQQSFTI